LSKYAEAGVNLELSDSVKERITEIVRSTFNNNVLSAGGEFGGIYKIPESSLSLVSSIDGVGTKLKVAFMANKHDTVGQDLVHHCVNDIAVMGAKPAFFLDYLATGELRSSIVHEIIKGLADACRQHSVALIGGETAQMPGMYAKGEYDLAGAIVGFLEKEDTLPQPSIELGDILVGFRSSGLHTNGYSLVRKIVFEQNKWTLDTHQDELKCTWGEELLKIHLSYYDIIRLLIKRELTKALVHVTGGGIPGNLTRVLPPNVGAEIYVKNIPSNPVFSVLQESGNIQQQEMYQVFNMGVGVISVCTRDSAEQTTKLFPEDSFVLGQLCISDSEDRKLY